MVQSLYKESNKKKSKIPQKSSVVNSAMWIATGTTLKVEPSGKYRLMKREESDTWCSKWRDLLIVVDYFCCTIEKEKMKMKSLKPKQRLCLSSILIIYLFLSYNLLIYESVM